MKKTEPIAMHRVKQSDVLPGVPRVPLASNSWKVKTPKVESPFASTTSVGYKSPNTGHMGLFKGTGNVNASAVTKSADQKWTRDIPWVTTAGTGTVGSFIGQRLLRRKPILGAALGAMGGAAVGLAGGRAAGYGLDRLAARRAQKTASQIADVVLHKYASS